MPRTRPHTLQNCFSETGQVSLHLPSPTVGDLSSFLEVQQQRHHLDDFVLYFKPVCIFLHVFSGKYLVKCRIAATMPCSAALLAICSRVYLAYEPLFLPWSKILNYKAEQRTNLLNYKSLAIAFIRGHSLRFILSKFVGKIFINHEIHEIITPRKLPAIR